MKSLYKQILFGAILMGVGFATPVAAASDNVERNANQIAADVKSSLGQYENIQVEILDDGEVLLSGTVKTDTEMDDAVRRARDIAGVTEVENEIEVIGPESGNVGAYIDDAGVTAAVKAKLMGQEG
ncbi:MAG: BON domain-containing protein, partial [Desulfovibrionaceae bacterium]|nr:BON domain-containing protein [Desulfovibrionaceae bacterium]